MKTKLMICARLVAFALLAFALTSCVIAVDGTTSTQGVGSVVVTYRVETSGSASVNQVRWQVGGIVQSQFSPGIPWTRTVRANPGDRIYLAADASATGGAVRISYEASRNGQSLGRGLLTCQDVSCPNFELSDTISN